MTPTTLASALGLVGLGALLMAGCRSALDDQALRPGGQYSSCAADLRDVPCVACLKARCCAQATTCSRGKPHRCSCALQCLDLGNTRACAEACADPDDRAMALCTADACAAVCPGGR